MESLMNIINAINGVIWHPVVLYVVLGVGVLFTIWSGFGQYRSLTHGTKVVRGAYDDKNDPGAINHFQALSAALSATVGLGNIAGVGVAVALGGPGAVFWMWMVGLFGMAIKTTEVTLSMLFRNTDDPDNPHGGPMFVAKKAFAAKGMGAVGSLVGGVFVITLLISTITGGNMFQAWSVGEITENYFQIDSRITGIVLAVLVGMVIIGGIKRIGAVAGRIVPIMCIMYIVAAIVVLIMFAGKIPDMLALIVREAFTPSKAEGAFLGGTAGYALLWGMKRALFSSEAGQGSSPIAHSAAKTSEPVREGIVAGLEPFIDTIVVCTMTALVILSTGAFNRGHEAQFDEGTVVTIVPVMEAADQDNPGEPTQKTNKTGTPLWTVRAVAGASGEVAAVPPRTTEAEDISGAWKGGEDIFIVVEAGIDSNTGLNLHRLPGEIKATGAGEDKVFSIKWGEFAAKSKPTPVGTGRDLFVEYPGPSLTGYAFDRAIPGLGKFLVTIAAWMFALSTMISWSYYGEQGIVFLFGSKAVLPYKFIYCVMIIVAAWGFIKTDAELDSITALGTGVMLWANIPIMLIFGSIAMKAYHAYSRKLKAGEFHAHEIPPITDVIEGHDVEE